MFRVSQIALFAAAFTIVSGAVPPIVAQERYDDLDPKERFVIRVGGFAQDDTSSTIQINSSTLGLGTIINLEDQLEVEDEVTVVRLDGFYRFNPRHRIDWTYFRTYRQGTTRVTEELQIGDEIFEVDDVIESELTSNLLKFGWNYSFINTRKYEAFVGAGLNFRDMFVKTKTIEQSGGGSESESNVEEAGIPLPVLVAGGRYNFNEKSSLRFRYEVFDIEIGDFDGRFQDTSLLFEHNTFKNFGFGGGINSFDFDLEATDDDLRGEVETNYTGLLLYVKAYFD